MADVGVLNLQIHDDSSKAAEGLGRLATKLESVKKAAQGLNLGNLAKQISNIGKAVEEQVHGSTIEKLTQLSDALQKVKSACEGINIPSLSGLKNIASATSGAKKSGTAMLDGVKETVQETKSGLQEIGQEIQQTPGADETVKSMEAVSEAADQAKQSIAELNQEQGNAPKYQLPDWAKDMWNNAQEAKQSVAEVSTEQQGAGKNWPLVDWAQELRNNTQQAKQEMQELTDESRKASTVLQEVKSTLQSTSGTTVSDTTAAVQNEAKAATTAAQAAPALAEMKSEAQSAASGIREVSGAAGEMTDSVSRGSSAVGTIKSSFRQLGEATKSLLSPLTGVISSLARVARYRMLRAVIKQVTKGIKEGTENYYRYSNAIGSSFAPAMDSVSSSLSQMKNSIGAAAAPAISAVIPILNSIISLAITAINYLNQLIALLRGQSTWSRATTQSSKAFDDVKKSAGGAGSAIKDLLADWDELNIIQSESGGGGGGGASGISDWLNMFEEVSEFNKTIQDIVDGINDQFGSVENLVKRIGAAILAWKLSTALTGGMAALSGLLAALAVADLTLEITAMVDRKFLETGEPGWLVADVLTNLVGGFLVGSILEPILGGGTGFIASAILMEISAGVSYGVALAHPESDNAKTLKEFALAKAAIATAALAAGFSVSIGSLWGIPLAIGAGAAMFTLSAAVTVVVEQLKTAQEVAKAAFSKTGEGGMSVEDVYAAVQTEFDKASEGYSIIIKSFDGVDVLKSDLSDAFATIGQLTAVIRGDGALTEEEAKKFKETWQTIFSAFEGVTAQSFETVFAGLSESLKSENEKIREQAKELRVSLLMIQNNMSEAQAKIKNKMDALAEKIATGTATHDEETTYFDYLEQMAKASNNSLTELEEIINSKQNIDFGDADEAIQNANQYIEDVLSGAATATEEIDKGYKAEIDALDNLRQSNEMMYALGEITKEQYETAQQTFDEIEKVWTSTAEENKKKVQDTVNQAFGGLLDQAMSGLELFRGEDGKVNALAAGDYMLETVAPIIDAMRKAGVQINEEFANMLGIGVNFENWDKMALVDWIRGYYNEEDILEAIDYGLPESVDNTVPLNTTIEETVTHEYIDADTEDWSMEGMFEEGPLAESEQDINSFKDTALAAEREVNAIALDALQYDTSPAESSAASFASSIEAMVSRIRSALLSLRGLSVSFSGMGGTGGAARFTVTQFAAEGGIFHSGDVFSANENGSAELIGRYGNNTAVANNEQIVTGITRGVAQGNDSVVSALQTLVTVAQQIQRKEFTAKVVPSSGVGRNNQQSADAYSLITG